MAHPYTFSKEPHKHKWLSVEIISCFQRVSCQKAYRRIYYMRISKRHMCAISSKNVNSNVYAHLSLSCNLSISTYVLVARHEDKLNTVTDTNGRIFPANVTCGIEVAREDKMLSMDSGSQLHGNFENNWKFLVTICSIEIHFQSCLGKRNVTA